VCDDWIDVPLCMLTLSGMCTACLLVHGAVADKKLLVHPESSIALLSVVAVNMFGVKSKVNANLSNLRYNLIFPSASLFSPSDASHCVVLCRHVLASVLSRSVSGARVVLVNLMTTRPTTSVVVS
jgi:hypothetical protein